MFNILLNLFVTSFLYVWATLAHTTMRRFLIFLALIALAACRGGHPQRILFIGDSITDGKWGYECNGTRNLDDMNHIFGHSYMYICASHFMSAYPERDYKFFNRGISGNTIADISNRWQADAISLNPDVISILAGINDIICTPDFAVDTVGFEQSYRNILTASRMHNPDVRIVLGEPFTEQGFRVDAEGRARMACESLSRIVRRLALEYDAVFVPYQSMFDKLCAAGDVTYWIWDGVHPSPAGHYKMAELWQKYVRL
mgnify:CR=1 FL=1